MLTWTCSGGGGLLFSGHLHPGCLMRSKKYSSSASGDEYVSLLCLQYNLLKNGYQLLSQFVKVKFFLPIGMNFPVRPTEEVQHVCAFCIHAMNFFFTSRLQSVLSVKLRVGDNQSKWRVFDLRPVKVATHPWCSSLKQMKNAKPQMVWLFV